MINAGICGFAKSQKVIFENLRLLEVQKTFYKPMMQATAGKWRERASKDFEFTVKAWQLITHPPSSPTYRKAGVQVDNVDQYGSFKPTKPVFDAWDVIRERCKALATNVVVFQSPKSFNENKANMENLRAFFGSIERDMKFVWEPRGWQHKTIKTICDELDLVHAVDPFANDPVTHDLAYFRLHGSPPGERMYRYKYTDDDLRQLYDKCEGYSQVYVLFNNDSMYEDALRFMEITKQ